MRLIQRVSCFSLAVFLLFACPFTSFASGAVPAPTPSVAEYIFDSLLAANGVDAPLSSVSSWLGSWTGYDDYLEQGRKGELGAYSQYLYNIEHSTMAEEAKASARQQIDTVTGWMSMDWADVGGKDISVDGVFGGWVHGDYVDASLASTSVKGFLKTFASYGTGALDYIKKYPSTEYSVDSLTKPASYGDLFFSYAELPTSSGYAYYHNYYCVKGFSPKNKVYGYLGDYNPSTNEWKLYLRYIAGDAPYIGKSYGFVIKNWTFTFNSSTGKVGREVINDLKGSISLTPELIHQLPVPIFANEAAADAYVSNEAMKDIYNGIASGLPVTSVNQAAQTTDVKIPPIVITLPETGAKAAELLEQLSDAMDRIEELEAALKNAGLDIGWDIDVTVPTVAPTDVDVPGEDTGKITLADIIAKVEAVPAAVTAMFEKKLEPDDVEQDTADMKLPVSLADKFPFCVPYDIAYLVKSLSSTSEVPRFELPFKIHYLGFNYEQTFVVDMADWAVAVKILRTMLDLLFIAGLISVTRDLIRG